MPPKDDPNQQRRLLVAMALIFGLTVVYSTVFAPKPPEGLEGADGGAVAEQVDGGAPVAAVPAPPAPAPAPAGEQPPAGGEAPPAREVTLRRPNVEYTLSSQGAGLVHAVLQGEKNRVQEHTGFLEGWRRFIGGERVKPPQMDLAVPVPGAPLPLAASIEGSAPLPANLPYAVESVTDDSVTFRGQAGPWRVEKRLSWPEGGYELLYVLTLTNTSQAAQTGELVLHDARAIDPQFEHAPSMLGGVGNQARVVCYVAEDLEVRLPKDEPPETFTGPISFFGIDQTYFTTQLYPLDGPKQGRCVLHATPTQRTVQAGMPLQVGPGQSVTYVLGGYFGPKETDLLAKVPSEVIRKQAAAVGVTSPVHPPLEKVVDFGIWAVIAKVLLGILRFFHEQVGNWGIAIILLTVLVKVVLFPLTVKQMKSAEEMKKLQPRMEAIRKKYADDKERQQMETLKLYQEAKVNPLGGCFPLLIQMPVWIALYTALRTSFDIYGEPFFGPVWTDLTYRDPTYIIPLLLGLSMILTQRMQPQMGDATQQKMMTWVMPIVFTVMMLNIPAGLTLYIFTNNVLSVAQQYGLRKWLERKGKGKAAAA